MYYIYVLHLNLTLEEFDIQKIEISSFPEQLLKITNDYLFIN